MKYTLVTVTLNIQSSDLRPQQNSHPSSPSLPPGGPLPMLSTLHPAALPYSTSSLIQLLANFVPKGALLHQTQALC